MAEPPAAVYDAFVSYSHAKDKPVASALQSVIQKLGKPWYQRRSLRIFRDDTSLAATPELWPTLTKTLDQARYLIILASPEFAASKWCGLEVAHWLEHKSIDTLLIALTEGDLTWDRAAGDFVWDETTPLPVVLKGRSKNEPKWIDLRAFRAAPDARDAKLIDAGADLAAAIHGVPKEDLLSQEVRQQKRALRLALSAVAVVTLLAGGAGWQWREAETQRAAAQRAEKIANEQKEIAQQERDDAKRQRERAERALAAATQGANDLIYSVAIKIRNRRGIPIDLVRDVLDRARALQRQLSEGGETSVALKRSAAVALREMATTLLAQNEVESALEAAEQALNIMLGIDAAGSADPGLRRELSITHNRIGEARMRLARYDEALESFREALRLRQATPNEEQSGWRSDLARSYERVGDALVELRRLPSALEYFQLSRAERQQLVRDEPANDEYIRDLSISHEKVGDVRLRQDNPELALESYRESLRLRQSRNTVTDAAALRDLAVSYTKNGDATLKLSGKREAITLYRKALDIRETLAREDNRNIQWQKDLVVTLVKLAEVGDETRVRLVRALEIVRRLDGEDRLVGREKRWPSDLEGWIARLPPL